jgi:hypothetical protein
MNQYIHERSLLYRQQLTQANDEAVLSHEDAQSPRWFSKWFTRFSYFHRLSSQLHMEETSRTPSPNSHHTIRTTE